MNEPTYPPCYRHPTRPTGISCQRCGKPICGECMVPASVGFHCPSCVGGGSGGGQAPRTARTRVGAPLRTRGMTVTYVLIGATVLLTLLDLVTRLPGSLLSLSTVAVADGQLWRAVTYTVLSNFPVGVILNGLVLFIIGRTLEPVFGWWRFLGVYVVAGLGGAVLLYWFAPFGTLVYGSSIAVLGLLGANAATKLRTHEDIRPDLVLLALLVGLNLVLSWRSMYWLGQIGGMVAAAAATMIIMYAPRRRRTLVQAGGLLGVAVVCLALLLVPR